MNDKVIYVGHRGGKMYGAVENTKEAFLSGVKAGCKALECDVRFTKDGKMIIFHDPDVKRLTEISNNPVDTNVNNVTFDELKNIELVQETLSGIGRGYICTFEEYLTICKENDVTPVIELKWTNGMYASNEDENNKDFSNVSKVIDMVKSYGLYEKSIFITFMKYLTLHLRNLYPDMKLQQLSNMPVDEFLDEFARLNIDLDILHTLCTKELVDECHKRGIKVNIWTMNDRSLLDKYIEMGVDYITSDYLAPNTIK